MTTLTNSEGRIINYTNEFIETILLQLNSSNNYYTAGDDDVIFIKIGSTKVLLLDYTYHINRTIFQNYNINENTINAYGLEFILNNTSNEYDLQSVYNGNSYIGIITELSQVFLAMYDTETTPYNYIGSENIDITANQISLSFPLKINDEIVMHPRAYGNVFDMISGTDMFSFRQNSIHGSTIIAQFFSETKQCIFHGECEIPNIYNKTSTDNLITQIYDDVYLKLEIDDLFTNINISSYYDKAYIDFLDNEISAQFLSTYTKTEVDALLTITNLTGSDNLDISNNQIPLNCPLTINDEAFLNPRVNGYFEIYSAPNGISFLQHISDGSQPIAIFNSLDKSVEFFGDLDIPNFYNKTELDSVLANVNPNIDLSNYYTKTEIDDLDNELSTLILNTYTKTEVDTLLFNSSSQAFSALSLINLELELNYKTATQLAETYYNKAEVDNLITFDPNVVYTKNKN